MCGYGPKCPVITAFVWTTRQHSTFVTCEWLCYSSNPPKLNPLIYKFTSHASLNKCLRPAFISDQCNLHFTGYHRQGSHQMCLATRDFSNSAAITLATRVPGREEQCCWSAPAQATNGLTCWTVVHPTMLCLGGVLMASHRRPMPNRAPLWTPWMRACWGRGGDLEAAQHSLLCQHGIIRSAASLQHVAKRRGGTRPAAGPANGAVTAHSHQPQPTREARGSYLITRQQLGVEQPRYVSNAAFEGLDAQVYYPLSLIIIVLTCCTYSSICLSAHCDVLCPMHAFNVSADTSDILLIHRFALSVTAFVVDLRPASIVVSM